MTIILMPSTHLFSDY